MIGIGVSFEEYRADLKYRINGTGTFEGTMNQIYDPQRGVYNLVEGYVGANMSQNAQGENVLKGSYELRTWELVFLTGETMQKSAPFLDVKIHYQWSCELPNDDEYLTAVSNCQGSATNKPPVIFFSIWSQFTSKAETSTSQCWPAGSENDKDVTIIMVPNEYDTVIEATVTYNKDEDKTKIYYVVYGDGCGDGGPTSPSCCGPALFKGCERAVDHSDSFAWGDARVDTVEHTYWLNSKMAPFWHIMPYPGVRAIPSDIAMWPDLDYPQMSSMTFTQYFNSYSRPMNSLKQRIGDYPVFATTDIIYESTSTLNTDQNELHYETKYVSSHEVESELADQPHTIGCYIYTTASCVIANQPSCYIGIDPENSLPTVKAVEVFFPSDLFTLYLKDIFEQDGVSPIKYRGQIQAFDQVGLITGLPIDVTGVIFPFHEEDSVSVDAHISPRDFTGPCANCDSFAVTIVSPTIPMLTNIILNALQASGKSVDNIIIKPTKTLLQFGIINKWTSFPRKEQKNNQDTPWDDVVHITTGLSAYCACTWKQCIWQQSQSPIEPDYLQSALKLALDTARDTNIQNFEHGLFGADDQTVYPTCRPHTYPKLAVAKYLDLGISHLLCTNNAIVYFRPAIGMDRFLEDLPTGADYELTLYGWATTDAATEPPLGMVCTLVVDITITNSVKYIEIKEPCPMTVNGDPLLQNADYQIYSASYTNVAFPPPIG